MLISSLPAVRHRKHLCRLGIAIGMCALLQVAAANVHRSADSRGTLPCYGTAEISTRQIRIKRLRPADPESTEVMLAARGLAYSDHRVS